MNRGNENKTRRGKRRSRSRREEEIISQNNQ